MLSRDKKTVLTKEDAAGNLEMELTGPLFENNAKNSIANADAMIKFGR